MIKKKKELWGEKKSVYDWLAHPYITRLDAIIPLVPRRGWLCDPLLSRLFLFFQIFSVPWLSFVLRVALTPLALLAVRSPRNNCPLLTPHRYYYPSFVKTSVAPGTSLSQVLIVGT